MLHPGYVHSAHDRDQHWITGPMLARLYRIRYEDCYDLDRIEHRRLQTHRRLQVMDDPALIHLRPREDGNYELPKPGRA